tara:strand:- start:4193 stop:4642 length:450 start_codon:yes stop_codon:yes gene_type:complete
MSCNFETPTSFSRAAKNDPMIAVDGSKTTLNDLLERYKGNTVFIEFWASWCADCIRGFPRIKSLQQKYDDVIFVFISVDEDYFSWKNGILRHGLYGEHYNLPKGMNDGDLVDFVRLGYIPRYMVVDKEGDIALFKSTKAKDEALEQLLY